MAPITIIQKYAVRALLTLRYGYHGVTRTGCFGRGQARYFTPAPSDTTGPSLRAGLFRHHVKQFHEASCSVASVVSAINTLAERTMGPKARPVTQAQLLDRVNAAHWKERMGPNGHNGRRGLPIDVLAQVIRSSLFAYAIPHTAVDVIHARGGKDAAAVKAKIKTCLNAFQTQDNCIIIAHFDQGSFIKEMNIPHISPVGGFDPNTEQVTILDVDPCQPLPYNLPFFRFYKGLATAYGGLFKPFGYGRGGIVVIRLE
ncbi:MAG: phytochelatin synthase [Desulfobacterales bacterium]|nr:MAG: phytochelatin synthase [Desulfobacterales bacterium]